MKHFGVNLVQRKYSFKLNREEFAMINIKSSFTVPLTGLVEKGAYADESGKTYKEEWCKEYREICLKNYDFNMKYFDGLDKTEFESAVCDFLENNKEFQKVDDLNLLAGKSGYYLMVLDEYKQVYIGKTDDIKKRIMQHWSKTKSFDRTLLPMYNDKSCFSIDFFRALDTTRIFVYKSKLEYGTEAELIDSFPAKFCTNRIGGDVVNLIDAIDTINSRI